VALMRRPSEWRSASRSMRVAPLYVVVFLRGGPSVAQPAAGWRQRLSNDGWLFVDLRIKVIAQYAQVEIWR
jgi:hypothetical protein